MAFRWSSIGYQTAESNTASGSFSHAHILELLFLSSLKLSFFLKGSYGGKWEVYLA